MERISHIEIEDAAKVVAPYLQGLDLPIYRFVRSVMDFSPKMVLQGAVYSLVNAVGFIGTLCTDPKAYFDYRKDCKKFIQEQENKYRKLGLETKLEREAYGFMSRVGSSLFSRVERDTYTVEDMEEIVYDTLSFTARSSDIILEKSAIDEMTRLLCDKIYVELRTNENVLFLDSVLFTGDFEGGFLFIEPIISSEDL